MAVVIDGLYRLLMMPDYHGLTLRIPLALMQVGLRADLFSQIIWNPLITFNLKFIAEDIFHDGDAGSGGSLVEAAIDDFSLEYVLSEPSLLGDLNNDLTINVLDVIILGKHGSRF